MLYQLAGLEMVAVLHRNSATMVRNPVNVDLYDDENKLIFVLLDCLVL